MHQNQWIAAISELEAKEGKVVPNTFNRQYEQSDVAYKFMNCSEGMESQRKDAGHQVHLWMDWVSSIMEHILSHQAKHLS